MKLDFLLLGFLLVTGSGVAVEGPKKFKSLRSDNVEWNAFKKKFSKNYESFEKESERKAIFIENLNEMREHNKKYEIGEQSFYMGVNSMTDLRLHEFKALRHCITQNKLDEMNMVYGSDDIEVRDIPETVDWRREGAVTKVKNQGRCGCCYVFATAGAIEGHNFIKTGELVTLSEQFLLDCSIKAGNDGCLGGRLYKTFHYIVETHDRGVPEEKDYPRYDENEHWCRPVKRLVATINGYKMVLNNNMTALQAAVAKGPVAIEIYAPDNFRNYGGGLYYCTEGGTLGHAILIVGYKQINGVLAWIIKNSWGSDWGDDGYMMMAVKESILCALPGTNTLFGTYPVM